jgi:hypothetical protein
MLESLLEMKAGFGKYKYLLHNRGDTQQCFGDNPVLKVSSCESVQVLQQKNDLPNQIWIL